MSNFKMPDSLNQVATFHEAFRHPIGHVPTLPSPERSELRVSLIQEELNELKEGIKNGDIVEIADALCDIQYVLAGAILEFGLGHKFEELFNEVQRSNMSKMCKNSEELEETLDFYEKQGVEVDVKKNKQGFIVIRSSDDKILKNRHYSPADLRKIL